ncbi:transmembrane 9 superfamily member 3-like [Lycium ferocissimum]|uniref:transmembrane 9 superfamily member 3-like n=1 Tax=Lycium ferocissimum TaxID=112874 RepID=UPI0028156D64|nr:transmembrane 9 superfamily member 3-like [Lycium ferocissimum]XP_059301089.1 transmembrane 9 superfamily member 3-like [Lycium ferocissimum]XP_059301096.1 transmembrane 9 superfamily member 3-like [Lycium ferocissimum]
MEKLVVILIFTTVIMSLECLVQSDASTHRYKSGDEVPLYANKVGPFSNPSETYAYFDLPFCRPDNLEKKKESLGEVLNGDRLTFAPYKLEFLVDKDAKILCKKKLTVEEVAQFRTAVALDYYVQIYYDDLPIWAFLGKVEKEGIDDPNEYKYHIYTFSQFEIYYNKDRVIEISHRIDPSFTTDVTNDEEVDVEFRYTVVWKATETPFEKRMDKYTMSSSLPRHLEIHWFSILNSCVTIFILVSCLGTVYLRVLRRDIYKLAQDEEFSDNQEETGWKSLHGDVFRYPKYKHLLSSVLGCGTQMLAVVMTILGLGVLGVFQPYDRGVLPTALIIIYVITSAVAGFSAVSFYHQLEGSNWLRLLLLAGGIFFCPLLLTFFFLNTVAINYGSTAALPVDTIVVILLLWVLLALPSLMLGGVSGKRIKSEFQAPCHTTKCPREVPPQPCYRSIVIKMAVAGALSFAVIYVELYYILASVWGYRIYTTYSILFVVFILLLITTALVSIAMTYFQLAREDHQWWWSSFLCGGSTGLYLFGYSFYYYFSRSDMNGFMQTSFFFGYMACVSYGVFLMLGTVSFHASLLFVRLLYGSIKCE